MGKEEDCLIMEFRERGWIKREFTYGGFDRKMGFVWVAFWFILCLDYLFRFEDLGMGVFLCNHITSKQRFSII